MNFLKFLLLMSKSVVIRLITKITIRSQNKSRSTKSVIKYSDTQFLFFKIILIWTNKTSKFEINKINYYKFNFNYILNDLHNILMISIFYYLFINN